MRYRTIVFLQGEDYDQMLTELGDNDSIDAMADYLRQWDYGDDDADIHTEPPWGTADTVYDLGDQQVLTINYGLGYASLTNVWN